MFRDDSGVFLLYLLEILEYYINNSLNYVPVGLAVLERFNGIKEGAKYLIIQKIFRGDIYICYKNIF